MKFDSVNNTGKKFVLPRVAFQLANFKEGDMLDLNINNDIVVVLKKNMNAMELINAAATLHTLYMELTDHLVDVCGDCEECFDTCPAEDVHKERISLPDYLLREAGIPVGSKLWASVDEAQGIITVAQAEHERDLSDVPDWLLDELLDYGICAGALEHHLVLGDTIYGD